LERAKAENWPGAVKAGGHSFEGFCLNEESVYSGEETALRPGEPNEILAKRAVARLMKKVPADGGTRTHTELSP
jgi:hypothetical protein